MEECNAAVNVVLKLLNRNRVVDMELVRCALRGSGTTDRLTSDIVRFGNGCSVGSSVARPVAGRLMEGRE